MLKKAAGQFVLTGSNQPALCGTISQSLAGRTSIHHLLPLSLEELASENLLEPRDHVLHKGFLPRLYDLSLSPEDLYGSYFATYIERDVRRMHNPEQKPHWSTMCPTWGESA